MSENTYPTLHSPDLPPEALNDCMRPPERAVRVMCYHCDRRFSSDEMVWYRGDWWCPTITCGGVGYKFEVWPTSRR